MELDLESAVIIYALPIAITISIFVVGGIGLGYCLCDGYCDILQGGVTIISCFASFAICLYLFYLYLPKTKFRVTIPPPEIKEKKIKRKRVDELDEKCRAHIEAYKKELREKIARELVDCMNERDEHEWKA